MSDNKDWISLQVCPVCGKDMGILMDTRIVNGQLRKSLPKYCCTGPEMCDKCREKLTKIDHIIVYESSTPKEFTGRFAEYPLGFFVLDDKTLENVKECRFILAKPQDFEGIAKEWNRQLEEARKS